LLREANISLLLAGLRELKDSSFFTSGIAEHLSQLIELTERVQEKFSIWSPDLVDYFADQIWREYQFLIGSTRHRIPYEVIFCLSKALEDWSDNRTLITTAIIQERNFYFRGVNKKFYELAEKEINVSVENSVVQIMLPDLYRHRPLYNIPLFHELGHFIDDKKKIVESILLVLGDDVAKYVPKLEKCPPHISGNNYQDAKLAHLKEYFADLFCCCYVGEGLNLFLSEFAGDSQATLSHPSTEDRKTNVDNFLNGSASTLIDIFQSALPFVGLNSLQTKFESPSLRPSFLNLRPIKLASQAEVYGVFQEGWKFLSETTANPEGLWKGMSTQTVERQLNDLIEKSIRNYVIESEWNEATNQT
jgi:hypothetical protein